MTTISQFVFTFLLNSLWEVALIFGVAQLGSWILRGAPARFRHRLWSAAMLLAVALPLASLLPGEWFNSLLPLPSGTADQISILLTSYSGASLSSASAPLWMFLLASTFGAFLVFRIIQFAYAWHHTRQLRESAYAPEFSPEVVSAIEVYRTVFKIEAVSVRCSPLVLGPLTIGFWNSQILLPEDVLRTASPADWAAMLSHEMAHVRRNDFARNLIYEFLSLPISFHPLALLMKSQLVATREVACDELATERCIKPQQYVRSLLSMAGRVTHRPFRGHVNYSVGIFDGNILEERVMKLLHRNRLSVLWSRISLTVVLAALFASTISMAAFALQVSGGDGPTIWGKDVAGSVQGIARVGDDGVTAPHVTYAPDPEYPEAERKAKRNGTVLLWCVVEKNGTVHRIRVEKSLSAGFDENAMAAVRKWKFDPSTKNGKPIAVQVNITVDFRIY